MKKIISLIMVIVFAASLFCIVANGIERPVFTTALPNLTSLPTTNGVTLISTGLMAPSEYSKYSNTVNSLTDEQQWELGRYLKYGISVIGVSSLERPISAAIDGFWCDGNIGSALQNGSKANGAFAYRATETLYNSKGKAGENDSIYQILITFNFGKLAKLHSLGFVAGLNNMPQAADIYVSSDGENWTLVGGYDRTALRMTEGAEDMPTIPAADLGNDKADKSYTNGSIVLFGLNDVEGQFLRICGTSNAGKSKPANLEDYSSYSNAYDAVSAWREMLVYGTLLDKPNTVTAVEVPFNGDDQTNTQDPGNNNQDTSSLIPVKPSKNTEAKEEDEKQTTASENTDEQVKDKGCGAIVTGMGAILICGISAMTVSVSSRKRRKD